MEGTAEQQKGTYTEEWRCGEENRTERDGKRGATENIDIRNLGFQVRTLEGGWKKVPNTTYVKMKKDMVDTKCTQTLIEYFFKVVNENGTNESLRDEDVAT